MQLTSALLEEIHQQLIKDSPPWHSAEYQDAVIYDPDAVADARGVLHIWAGEDSALDDEIAKLTDNQAMALFINLASEDD